MTYPENGGKHELAFLTNLVKIITLFLLKYTPNAWYRWIAGNFYFISSIGYIRFCSKKTYQKIEKQQKIWIFHKEVDLWNLWEAFREYWPLPLESTND